MNPKQIITENTLFYLLIGILLLATFLDIYTAFTSPIFEIAEVNPIYVLTGSKVPLLIVTLIVTIWIVSNLNKSISLPRIFLFTSITLFLTFGHVVGVYANTVSTNQYMETESDPAARAEIIEQYQNHDMKSKLINYSLIVGVIVGLPFILTTISFVIAMYFHNQRKSKREKIMDEIYNLARRLNER